MFDNTVRALLATQSGSDVMSDFYVYSDLNQTPIKSVYVMDGQARGYASETIVMPEDTSFTEAYNKYHSYFVPHLEELARKSNGVQV